jgi:hypothetical protein
MPVRLHVRLTTKIGSKNSLYPHWHFTEQLVNAFRKSPWERNLNHEILSFLIRQLKNYTGLQLQPSTSNTRKIHIKTSRQAGRTAEQQKQNPAGPPDADGENRSRSNGAEVGELWAETSGRRTLCAQVKNGSGRRMLWHGGNE